MKPVLFNGCGTAIITPMKDDLSIHYELFGELLDQQLQQGSDAIVVAGTTGESATLTDEEHIELIRYAVKRVHGRIPVIAGAGSNNTAHAVHLSKEAERAGADALLHVTPYYNKASQRGLLLHFEACAAASKLIEAQFSDINPIPVKLALCYMVYNVGSCRLPLCDMEAAAAEHLHAVLVKYGLCTSDLPYRPGSVTIHRPKNTLLWRKNR